MANCKGTDPQALGAQYGLGNYRAAYKTSIVGKMIGMTFLSLVFLSGLVVIGSLGYFVNNFPFPILSFRLEFDLTLVLIFVVWVVATGIFLRLTVQIYQGRGLCAFVYDYGLVHIGRKSIETVIYWQNVREVRHSVRSYKVEGGGSNGGLKLWFRWYVHTYTIRCINDTSLKISWTFVKIRQLGKSIEVETARYLFPTVLKSYQMNLPVTFGPLTVTSQGLYRGAKLLPWNKVEYIDIDEKGGRIVIRKQRRWFRWTSIRTAKVPNVEVFRMLVQHIAGESVLIYSTRGNVTNWWNK